jgi:hypothetical protein
VDTCPQNVAEESTIILKTRENIEEAIKFVYEEYLAAHPKITDLHESDETYGFPLYVHDRHLKKQMGA